MLLSVIIVNWNSCSDLHACLRSLEHQTHAELDVIVVDNGSDDGSVAMVRQEFPAYTLLPQRENLGFAEGCNRGIEVARGTWIALLNNDAVAEPTWAAELVAAAENVPPTCGMLQSLMLYEAQRDKVNSTGIELEADGGGRDRHDGAPRPAPTSPWEEIFCPTGGAAAYRQTMLTELRLPSGYLDRDHFCYYEDMDLGWRARLAGWSAFFIPSAVVFHKYHASTARRGERWMLFVTRTNRIRTLLKNASLPFLLRTSPHSLSDMSKILWRERREGWHAITGAISTALDQRIRVGTLASEPRRAVERRWVQGPRTPRAAM